MTLYSLIDLLTSFNSKYSDIEYNSWYHNIHFVSLINWTYNVLLVAVLLSLKVVYNNYFGWDWPANRWITGLAGYTTSSVLYLKLQHQIFMSSAQPQAELQFVEK